MMRFLLLITLSLLFPQNIFAKSKDLIAEVHTNLGSFKLKLFYDKAPMTVANFFQLSTMGFYEGLTIHRIISGEMIQGGDPKGNGSGGPGYFIKDEFHSDLDHSKPGVISMVNLGPDSNGSQFMITLKSAKHLDKRNTVFGEVVSGLDVIEKISRSAVNGSVPNEKILIQSIKFNNAEWYSPVTLEKKYILTDVELEKITKKDTERLLSKVGEAMGLEKLKGALFESAQNRGNIIQIVYFAEYSKNKTAKILIIGSVSEEKSFLLSGFQFSTGN